MKQPPRTTKHPSDRRFPTGTLLVGDCRTRLADLDAESLDACVTDPPYHLTQGSRGGSPRNPGTGPFGRVTLGGDRGFMGASWDGGDVAFDPETWAAVHRVLKPGAHLLVCGGTRTYHRMAVAVEDAGFEIRDCIGWCYAQGLPKSLDVAGAIDRSSGASPAEWAVWIRRRRGELGLSREDLADQVACTPASVRDWEEGRSRKKDSPVEHVLPAPSYRKRLTAILGYPESEGSGSVHQAARDWDGWGTALKPAWEMILVARKPLIGTVAENVLAYGTGGLNVGGCRSGTEDIPINTFDDGAKPFGGGAGHPYTQRISKGRWPANVALSHAPECTVVGESRWACVSECPVRLLNDQAGVRTSGKVSGNGFAGETPTSVYGKFADKSLHADVVYGDSGSASRFFNVFDFGEADPIRFCAKAPRKERPVGADGTKHPCLAPDELVLTDVGYRAISTVRVGDHVYGADGRFHIVTDSFASPFTGELVEVASKATWGTTKATGNHPFLIWRPDKKGRRIVGGSVQWVEAELLQVGDFALTPVSLSQPTAEIDLDWAWAFGLWLAEGVAQSAGHGSNVYPSYTLNADRPDLVKRLRLAFPEFTLSVYPKLNCRAVQAMVFDPIAGAEFVRLGNRLSLHKRISPEVLGWSEDARRSVLNGYLAGDGCLIRGRWRSKTSSPDLAATLSLLAESVGFHVATYRYEGGRTTVIQGRTVRSNPYWQLYFIPTSRLQQRTQFVEYLGTRYSMRRVKSLRRIPYDGEVWNLTVDGSHTFQTLAGMSHNTVKPLSLMRWLVELVTPPGATVLDPFMGSGSLAEAASIEGRRWAGVEQCDGKDGRPDYVELIAQRMDRFAAKAAS